MSSKGQAIAAGVLGSLTVFTGISSSILYYYFLEKLYDNYVQTSINSVQVDRPPFHFWWTAIPFVVPGVLAVAAALRRNKLLFAFYLAVAVMTLLVTGTFFILIVIFVDKLPSVSRSDCETKGNQCECSNEPTGFRDCDRMFEMLVLAHVSTGVYVAGWALCFAGSLLSCAACRYIEKRRARAIVAYSTRHSPSVKVSTVQPPVTRRQGRDNVAYVYS